MFDELCEEERLVYAENNFKIEVYYANVIINQKIDEKRSCKKI